VNTDSMQVLKGPQGTLFGRNATGGAILITTKQPGSKPTGNFRLSYGRFNEVKAEAYVSGPVTDTISADLSLLYHDDNGYSRDVLRDTRLDTYREFSARSKILWSPDTDTSVLLIADISKVLDNTATSIRPIGRTTSVAGGFVPAGARELALTFDPYGKAWSGGGSIQAQHEFGGVTAKSISSYRETRYRARTDQDRTNLPVNRVDVIINEHYITQELTLTSSEPGPFQWVAGVYYFHDRSYTPTISNGVALTYPVMRTTSYAGFAEGTYAITDKLKLTAGVRYNHEKRSDDQKKPNGSGFLYSYRTATANAWTPRFSLLYALTDSSNVYATYSKGFKSGFFNAGTFDQPAVEPETLQMYEAGYKYAHGGMSFNLAGFYSDYKNLQLSTRLPNGITTTLNAAGAKIYGVDADFSAHLSDALILRLGGAYTHSKYVDFTGAPRYDPLPAGGNVLTTMDASGNPLIRTPKFTGTTQLTYEQPVGNGRVSATGSLYYNSGFAWTPDNRVKQGDYVLLNGQIAWSPDDNHYRISLWGKNLTNTLYSLGVSVSGFADAAAYARPRSYGVTAEYRF
jgi:iron complex outermembrane recepter protein